MRVIPSRDSRELAETLTRMRPPGQTARRSRRLSLRPPTQRQTSRIRAIAQESWGGQISALVTALAAIGALIFTSLSLQATREQIAISQQSQVTDRFSRAIEQLGNSSIEVRLGAIYELERLAVDSPRDHRTVIEVLAAYVRHQASLSASGDCGPPIPPPRTLRELVGPLSFVNIDIQSALTVLSRRDPTMDGDTRIDLQRTCLRGADLSGGNFAGADFSEADLSTSNMTGTDFHDAAFTWATLPRVNAFNSNFSDGNFFRTNLTHATLSRAILHRANLNQATLTSAALNNADMSEVDLSDVDLTDVASR